MPTKNSRVLTVRLREELADAVEREMARRGETRNALLTRLLTQAFATDAKKAPVSPGATSHQPSEG